MQASITKIFKFEAAHDLIYHDGKCKNLHGHSYKLEVTVAAPGGTVRQVRLDDPQSGMVIDFKVVSDVWKKHLEPQVDHAYLNDMLNDVAKSIYPTAEHVAVHLFHSFALYLEPMNIIVKELRLWETESSYVTVNS